VLHDLYYDWLPNFYPPLYFWVTGTLARFFTDSAIVAHKGGVIGTTILWFVGIYYLQKLFWHKTPQAVKDDDSITSSPWYWLILPIIYFLLLDFDAIVFKPYETLAALGLMIWLAGFIKFTSHKDWPKRYYWYLGLGGGLIFLLYYFWWLIIIPVLVVLWLTGYRRQEFFKKLLIVAIIVLAVSLPFVAPLVWSYFKYGWENWQAIFFVPGDFFTFLPYQNLSWTALWWLAGLAAMIIFYKKDIVKASLLTLIMCYLYQLVNILYFLSLGRPWQPSKPFLFLGTAALSVALAYGLVYFYNNYIKSRAEHQRRLAVLMFCFICLPLFPLIKFIDNQGILATINKDLSAPADISSLAHDIRNAVPDYQKRTWLSSGRPELNAYLPLSYYIANNINFSNHAARYSERLGYLENLTKALTPEDFIKMIDSGQPRPIDALLLYDDLGDSKTDAYPVYLWLDNYPNGGREQVLYLPKNLIDEKYWQKIYQKDNWLIYIKK